MNKFADWGSFAAAVYTAVANPFGILGPIQKALRAAWHTGDRAVGIFRQKIGEWLSGPLARFYLITLFVAVPLVFATAAAVNHDEPQAALHWSRGFMMNTMLAMVAVVFAGSGFLYMMGKWKPQRAPIFWSGVIYIFALRGMAIAAGIHAVCAESTLALLPASILALFALVMTYTAAAVLGWVLDKAIVIVEMGAVAAAAPLAVAPEIELEDIPVKLRSLIDLFRNYAWRSFPTKVSGSEITATAIFLILLSYAPSPGWAAVVGPTVLAVSILGLVASLEVNGLAADVQQSRKAFVWKMYKWSWVPLLAIRFIAFAVPELNETIWMSITSMLSWVNAFFRGEVGIGGGYDAGRALLLFFGSLVIMLILYLATKSMTGKKKWIIRSIPVIAAVYFAIAFFVAVAGDEEDRVRGFSPIAYRKPVSTAESVTTKPDPTAARVPPPKAPATAVVQPPTAQPPAPPPKATARNVPRSPGARDQLNPELEAIAKANGWDK